MADKENKDKLFGKPPTFGSPSTSAFGQSVGTSIFPSTQAQQTNLFQNANTGFGTPVSTQPSSFGTTSLFGQQQPASSSLFNTSSTFGQQNKSAGFGFSAQPTQPSLFGQQAPKQQTSTMFQPSTSNLFGSIGSIGAQANGTGNVKFNPVTGTEVWYGTTSINTKHHSITCMKECENKSFEELRYEDYLANRNGPQQQAAFGSTTPFGGVASSAPSQFGQPDTSKPAFTSFGQTPSTFGQGFATTISTPSLNFGFASNTQTNNPFGGTQQPKTFGSATPSMFGTNTATTQQSTFGAGGGLFGKTNTQNTDGKPAQPALIAIGTNQNQISNFSFSTTAPTQASTLSQPNKPLFGQTTATSSVGQTNTFGTSTFGSTLGKPTAPAFGTNANSAVGGSLGTNNYDPPMMQRTPSMTPVTVSNSNTTQNPMPNVPPPIQPNHHQFRQPNTGARLNATPIIHPDTGAEIVKEMLEDSPHPPSGNTSARQTPQPDGNQSHSKEVDAVGPQRHVAGPVPVPHVQQHQMKMEHVVQSSKLKTDTSVTNTFGSTLGKPTAPAFGTNAISTFGGSLGTSLQTQPPSLFGNNTVKPGGFFNNPSTGLKTFANNTFQTNTGYNMQPQQNQQSKKNIANFVQTENIPDLLCVTCERVLSQFPVYCCKGGSTCGRCPYPENGIRNEAYEVLAQNLKFPCSFNKDGCLENLYPKDVAEHEKMCRFRKYNCPAISNPACHWRGFVKNILDHFEEKHQMLILDENFFEIDFVNSHNVNYLFPYGEGLYLVNLKNDTEKHMFICTVSHMGHDPFEGCASYKIILESGNKSRSHEVSEKVGHTVHINRDVLNSVLNDPLVILAKIEIFRENQEISCDDEEDGEETDPNINYELLQELECMVCLEYMVPPIHQCITGHSICLSCKEEVVTECPLCRKEFQNTQNFALAQIIQHINYPCKNSKCKYSAKPKDIKLHQATCIYSPYPCPLKDYFLCETKMPFEDLYDHIQDFHYENLLELDIVSIPFPKDNEDPLENLLDDCFIIKHRSLLFKLHFSYNNEEFMFAAQLIGPSEDSIKYNFEIDILSCSGNDYRALMLKSCGPLTDSEIAFDNNKYVVIFSFKQIETFISDQLCFRVRISNN